MGPASVLILILIAFTSARTTTLVLRHLLFPSGPRSLTVFAALFVLLCKLYKYHFVSALEAFTSNFNISLPLAHLTHSLDSKLPRKPWQLAHFTCRFGHAD